MAKLIIVDDDKYFISSLLKLIDWETVGISSIFTAANIMNAKQIIAQKKVNVLLCDIEMTNENGFDLVDWLSNNYPYCKVILLTGYADFKYANKAIKYGCIDYILKPVKPAELEKAIDKALNKISSDTKISSLSIINEFRNNYGEITLNKFFTDIISGVRKSLISKKRQS
jgi:two-component system response regulator YesN